MVDHELSYALPDNQKIRGEIINQRGYGTVHYHARTKNIAGSSIPPQGENKYQVITGKYPQQPAGIEASFPVWLMLILRNDMLNIKAGDKVKDPHRTATGYKRIDFL